MNLTCIICPKGCHLQYENGTTNGNACKRGAEYAKSEATAPMRNVTSTLPVTNRGVFVSVKTETPIPKHSLQDAMQLIRSLSAKAPISRGEILAREICGTNLIAIMTVL